MQEKRSNVVWITGASSGIGAACAKVWASQKADLILTGTSENRLAEVAEKCRTLGARVALLPCNLSDESRLEPLAKQAWQCFDGIDVLYCNAGISQRTSVEDTSAEMTHKIMAVNFFAPAILTRALLPYFIQRGGGRIAVTTSIAGRFGFPLRCAYSASKHALYGYFETLAAEYANRGIRVTMVCPGRVRTRISLNALDKNGQCHGVMDAGQAGGLSAEKAAKKIVRGISRGKREVLVGRKELIMVYIKRFLPGLCALLSKKIKPM